MAPVRMLFPYPQISLAEFFLFSENTQGKVTNSGYFSRGGVPEGTLWEKASPTCGFRMQKL